MSTSDETVALLPMKANSQRVKGKNFRTFAGKPLCRWILDTLISLEEIDKVVINTDARNLLAQCGIVDGGKVVIHDRPIHLCGDEVSMNKVLKYDIAASPARRYLMTHTTNPLLSGDTIRRALLAYENRRKEHDSLFTVNRFQTRFYRSDNSPVNHDPDNLVPTQELEEWYEENSLLYLFTKDSFEASGSRIGESPLMYVTPRMESIDIDVPEEWHLAEVLTLSKELFNAHSSGRDLKAESGPVEVL